MITESRAEAVTALSKAAEAIAPIVDKPAGLVVDALRFTGRFLGAPLTVATEMPKDALPR